LKSIHLYQVPAEVGRRLTSDSTGLAISWPLIFLVDCSPVNRGVRRRSEMKRSKMSFISEQEFTLEVRL